MRRSLILLDQLTCAFFMKTTSDPIHYQLLALRAKMHGNPDQVDASEDAECQRLTKLYNTTKKINLRLAKILIRSR